MICTLFLSELVDLNTYINGERRNRFIGAKIKQDMTNVVAKECQLQKLPRMKQITDFMLFWEHKNRKKDFDNVEFGVKWIKDGMVKAGVIANDGWKHFPPKTVHIHSITGQNRVSVHIEYIPL